MNPDRDMMHPREIVRRLQEEGIGGLTEYTLYRLLKSGAIPARKPGRCYIVSYNNVLSYLRCAGGGDITPPPQDCKSNIIRPLGQF